MRVTGLQPRFKDRYYKPTYDVGDDNRDDAIVHVSMQRFSHAASTIFFTASRFVARCLLFSPVSFAVIVFSRRHRGYFCLDLLPTTALLVQVKQLVRCACNCVSADNKC